MQIIENKDYKMNETVKVEGLNNPFQLGGIDTNNTSANFYLANKKQGKTFYVKKWRHSSIDEDGLMVRDSMLDEDKSVVGKMSI